MQKLCGKGEMLRKWELSTMDYERYEIKEKMSFIILNNKTKQK